MRDWSAVIEPGDRVSYGAEIRACRIEVVRYGNGVKVVHRAAVVDDPARGRIEQHWNRQRVSKRDTYGGCALTRRILFIDFLNRYQKVLAVLMDAAERSVGEPDMVACN